MLYGYKEQFIEDLNDLVNAAELIAQKENVLEMDEQGYFFVQATGKLEDIIPKLEDHIERLKRIKLSKDSTR